MRKFHFILLSFLALSYLSAQSSLSGIVNVFSSLQEQDNCLNTIELENAAEFTEGMGILIIQMKGAGIETGNNANFGNLSSLNGAGLYEYNQITSINGQTLTLANTLQNDYISANSQVVGFEIHTDAIISSEITAPAWNGTTGGIVIIEAVNSLTLQADINVNGLGFRGGLSYIASDDNCNFATFSNNYSYESGNWRGAPKGEGIADFVSGHENGRGAQANGGGGGNSHNSGGGGGALHSIGGIGGTNEEPSFFGCSGNFSGIGGKSLINSSTRIFLGGGGGSGHSNNNAATRGGSGGGIIILKAPEIVFSTGEVTANGLTGDSTSGDGAGGGGSAGSILIVSDNVSGVTAISAQGGTGGNADNQNQNRCFGPGGGGSGGLFMSNIALSPVLTGGTAGESLNSTACSGNNGAMAGSNGIIGNNFSALVQGNVFETPSILTNSPDTIICQGELLQLAAEVAGDNLSFQWQLFNNNNWENIAGAISSEYDFTVNQDGIYRLNITPEADCFPAFSSPAMAVTSILSPTAAPSFSVDGFDVQFMSNAQNATSVQWIFPDAQNSDEINPTYSFSQAGTYEVLFEAHNNCGQTTTTLMVEISSPLFAQFSQTALSGCAPLTILFTDESTGQANQRLWTFEGGTPATSTETNPLIEFSDIGTFEVSLSIQNNGNSSSSTIDIIVLPPPIPDFSFETDGLSVQFNNLSTNADNYVWNFGDNENSTLESPLHTYAVAGSYEVVLNAVNEFCGTTFSQTIGVNITNSQEIDPLSVNIFPNPGSGIFNLEGIEQGDFSVYNIEGQLLFHKNIYSNKTLIDLIRFPAGIYFVHINSGNKSIQKRVLKF